MRTKAALVGFLGLLLAAYVIAHIGLGAVFSGVLAIGWSGFSLLCAYSLMLSAVLATGWWVLVSGSRRVGWRAFLWARLARDAASETLPLSQVGGFIIGARAAILDGVAPVTAAASMVVDVTTEMTAQLVYICLGVALLGAQIPVALAIPSNGLLTGVAIAAFAAGGFFAVQRFGGGIARILAARFVPRALSQTEAVIGELEAIHRSPGRIGVSLIVHMAGWLASGTGTWIAFRFVGAPVGLAPVIAVESLISGLRSIAFVVPNAIGVQEAAYAAFAPVLGVGPEVSLAISILKRARDVAIGVPVLLIWQALESQRAVAAARTDN